MPSRKKSAKAEKQSRTTGKCSPIARELDGKMRGILNDLFGKEICEPLFGSMNLFDSSGGLPV